MEGTGIGTDVQDLLEGEDQELRVLDGLEGYDGLQDRAADEGFAKETAAADNGQDGFVTPAVFVDHMDLAAEDDADVVHFILGQDKEFSFADRPDPCAQAGEHSLPFFLADAGK